MAKQREQKKEMFENKTDYNSLAWKAVLEMQYAYDYLEKHGRPQKHDAIINYSKKYFSQYLEYPNCATIVNWFTPQEIKDKISKLKKVNSDWIESDCRALEREVKLSTIKTCKKEQYCYTYMCRRKLLQLKTIKEKNYENTQYRRSTN